MEKNETRLKNKVIYFGCFHRNAKRQSANNVTLRFSREGLYLTLPYLTSDLSAMVVRGLLLCMSVARIYLIKADDPIITLEAGLNMDFLFFSSRRRGGNQYQIG